MNGKITPKPPVQKSGSTSNAAEMHCYRAIASYLRDICHKKARNDSIGESPFRAQLGGQILPGERLLSRKETLENS